MSRLTARSIEIIKQHQAPSGAYVASPNFPTYRYSWLRDGAFVAYAMEAVGEKASARAFHSWVDSTLRRHAWKLDILKEKQARGVKIYPDEFLHTRYTLTGEEALEPWGNFQLDGYGTWLWAVANHAATDTGFFREIAATVEMVVEYLCRFWNLPNFDCWEENSDRIHPATLGAIYGGLKAVHQLRPNPAIPPVLDSIRQLILGEGAVDGRLRKYLGSAEVDSSLLWVSTPFGVLEPHDPIMMNTVHRIETDLVCNSAYPGGVRRYKADTYYGGGEWILLSAWLGWHYLRLGDTLRALSMLRWIEEQADADGQLPEQIPVNMNNPAYHDDWVRRWGPIAKPLLWSHAMYLVLQQELKAAGVRLDQECDAVPDLKA